MDESTRVAVANGEFEAQQILAFLASRGIAGQLRGEALRNTHGLTLDGLGAVEIHVSAERFEEAQALLSQVDSGELALDDAAPEPDPAPDSE